MGLCMNIHSIMGFGFLEAVYAEVLEKEFIKNCSFVLKQKNQKFKTGNSS
ncbi:GxxExxY protein [Cloacibacterium rupense]